MEQKREGGAVERGRKRRGGESDSGSTHISRDLVVPLRLKFVKEEVMDRRWGGLPFASLHHLAYEGIKSACIASSVICDRFGTGGDDLVNKGFDRCCVCKWLEIGIIFDDL